MRSINTTLISVLPVLGLLVVAVGLLGVGTLKDLALVQLVGIIVGAFSSIFFATPLLVDQGARPAHPRAGPPGRRPPGADGRGDGRGGSRDRRGVDGADDDALAGELRRERAMAAAAGVPSRTAPAGGRPANGRRQEARPTGKRRR